MHNHAVEDRKGTCLDHIHSNILNTSFNLLAHEVRRRFMYPKDALCILRRQGCRGGHGIASMGGDHLLIGFEATACEAKRAALARCAQLPRTEMYLRPTRAIGAGDCQDAFGHV
jgi:hypothetical protein